MKLTAATQQEAAQCEIDANCPAPVVGNCSAEQPSEADLTFYFNGAESVDSLYALDNIRVANDLPKELESGTYGYARMCVFQLAAARLQLPASAREYV